MKKFILLICLMTIMPVLFPAVLHASRFTSPADESGNYAIPEVIRNDSSQIVGANYTATLADGTIIGFNHYQYYNFIGAITSSTSLTVPDTIIYDSQKYVVASGEINIDKAPNLTSLTLSSGITQIRGTIPPQILNLHIKSETPASLNSTSYISKNTMVWVPASCYDDYLQNSYWREVDVVCEGWEPMSLTVTVNSPGTLVNEMLKLLSDWSKVEELTVIGSLNHDDLKFFSRFRRLRTLDLTQTDITTIDGCKDLVKLRTVLLPSTVVNIEDEAFRNCSFLNYINTPNVVKVGSHAFERCMYLTDINLPNATEIGEYAFMTSGLSSLSLPKAKDIGKYSFSNCHQLKSVNIPEAEILRDACFQSCSSLTNVNFPSTLKEIGGYAFQSLHITELILPEGLIKIGYAAFNGCDLSIISIPSTIQVCEYNSFSFCGNVKDLYCYAAAPPDTDAFTETCFSNATLHVPAFSLAAYYSHEKWYRFSQIVPIEGNFKTININQAFTINTYNGLEEKADLNLNHNGHLSINAGSPFRFGTLIQKQCAAENINSYGISTLITSDNVEADNTDIHLRVAKDCWNFISFPFDVNVADIGYPEGTLWVIRKYSGADRAKNLGNTWLNMTDGMTLRAGEGYILHCTNEAAGSVEFLFHAVDNGKKNALFASEDVVTPLSTYTSEYAHNRSWNLVGNPYPAYFDTRAIEHEGVITVYDNSRNKSGSYTAYSLIDDEYVLRPNEAFFVQCPEGATGLTFKAEGRMHDGDNKNQYRKPIASNNCRKVYNFILSDDETSDRARLVINEEAGMEYEISRDASKFMSDDITTPQLYVLDNSIRYAIDERPLGNGVITLGARFGHDGNHSIRLHANSAEDMDIILTDHETGYNVNLSEEEYIFTAEAGTCDNRFTVTIGGDIASITNTGVEGITPEDTMFDLMGRKVDAHQQKGVFIIKHRGKYHKEIR